ncbi:RNA polymerase sigma factor (sigma-70 family) [Streptacidiphilus sp. MAP12-16]|uniref:sigma-70 family RNA polymerase sigma factor n=1 Tax=Streptacidiphilus sp. MAP12-16 TaxID=3156300 RepID=UPI003511757A
MRGDGQDERPADGMGADGSGADDALADDARVNGPRMHDVGAGGAKVPPQGPRHRAGDTPAAPAATVPPPGGPVDEEELPPSDAQLTAAVRAGDDSAFEELYRRHAAAVRRYARTCCRDSFTAEDLAGEVFARTLQALRAGKGPGVAVRAYLLTAVRNIAATWSRSDRREQLVDDFTLFAATSAAVADVSVTDPGADAWAMAEIDQALVVRAFSRLDPDDRMVLWHTEVEREPPREVAVLLGKSANATAVQAHRARDRLATEFLQAHISDTQESACEAYASRLGAFARGSLGKRASGDVRGHMKECDRCSAAYLELVDVNHSLRELLPVGALVWVGSGYFTALVAGLGAGAAATGAGAGAGAAAGTGGGSGTATAAASEGLGVPAKAGIAAVVTVAAVAGVVFALSGNQHKVPPPRPQAVRVSPKPVAPVPRPPAPPTPVAAAPSTGPVLPARVQQALRPVAKPTPKPVLQPSPRPRPAPQPTPTPTPTPAPSPVPADYSVDALPFSGSGTTSGPSLEVNPGTWVWQRSNGVRVGGRAYRRGVTVHAPLSVTVDLNRPCTEFDAMAGIDDITLGLGAVRFSVLDATTGNTLWQSAVIGGGDPAVPVSVGLQGMTAIQLVVQRADGQLIGNVADWADARFSCR